jgi:hypothetical protein
MCVGEMLSSIPDIQCDDCVSQACMATAPAMAPGKDAPGRGSATPDYIQITAADRITRGNHPCALPFVVNVRPHPGR